MDPKTKVSGYLDMHHTASSNRNSMVTTEVLECYMYVKSVNS